MSADPALPHKRARTEAEDEPAMKMELKHDEKVWLDDGNIVIVAQNVAFRVHRSVLSLHSEVFRDMFTIPPPDDEETIDGCPAVRVSDTADGMRHMLWALYNGRTFPEHGQVEFDVVAALVRMAHKYQISYLCDETLSTIKELYVEGFLDFIACKPRSVHPRLTYKVEDAFQVVQLAHLTNTPSLLPAALYLCCTSEPFCNLSKNLQCFLADRGSSQFPYLKYLTEEDIFRCLSVLPRLVQVKLWMFGTIFSGISPDCVENAMCKAVWSSVTHDKFFDGTMHSPDGPIDTNCLETIADDVMRSTLLSLDGFTFCYQCSNRCGEREDEARDTVWHEMPTYFGLAIPNWPESES
ncbi:uncharacterized protein C8Q71DRAFT_710329 [Rhodofomes roseus]|uniref:BTB domain-containing protein n=1 Tax=Rhodofomes roseus TaxID=34475 RepID=A0ABQ8KDL8_9APHY|nr:uncharacterized protein C8Q71DRAFT_710329 [Rhodofomes roseus]KAH9835450.1 hypothetical protein C8Q71DRAFT_710329 [Rhodofomes roseus]